MPVAPGLRIFLTAQAASNVPAGGVGAVMRDAKTCSRSCSSAMRRRQPLPPPPPPNPLRRATSGSGYCSWACFNEDRYQRTGSFAGGWHFFFFFFFFFLVRTGSPTAQCGKHTPPPPPGMRVGRDQPGQRKSSTACRPRGKRNQPHEVRTALPQLPLVDDQLPAPQQPRRRTSSRATKQEVSRNLAKLKSSGVRSVVLTDSVSTAIGPQGWPWLGADVRAIKWLCQLSCGRRRRATGGTRICNPSIRSGSNPPPRATCEVVRSRNQAANGLCFRLTVEVTVGFAPGAESS